VLTSLFLGALVGLVLGLTGAGGGILAAPALVFGTGWPMQQAAPVALMAVAGAACLGAAHGLRRGLVRYKAAVLMALAGVPATGLGLAAAHRLPQRLLLVLFAATLLFVAARQLAGLRRGVAAAAAHEPERWRVCRLDPATGRLRWTLGTGLALAGVGALTGFLSGLLGVGGGFVVVPMLKRFTDISPHGIVATSLLVIALVGTGGVVTAFAHGARFPLAVTAAFLAVVVCGMVAGRALMPRLAPRRVHQVFAVVVALTAAGLLAKAVLGGA